MTFPRDAEVYGATGPRPSSPPRLFPDTAENDVPQPAEEIDLDEPAARGRPRRGPSGLGPFVRARRERLRRGIQGLSLQSRLVVILLTAVAVALIATGYLGQHLLRDTLVSQVDQQLTNGGGRAVGDALEPPRYGESERGIPGGFVVQLWDGQPSGPREIFPPTASDPAFPNLAAEQYATISLHTIGSTSGHTEWRSLSAVYSFPSATGQEIVFAQVALPLTNVEATVAELRLVTLTLGALLIALCALLGWLAIRRSFRPLIEVEETAAAIAAGDLSRRIPERPETTEVGRLTSSLNGMLTQIESAFRQREASEARTRQFAADASHELRTPLVSIRGFAELYRQGAVPPDEVPRTMRRIEDEAKRMGVLVEDLLLLARLDAQRPGRTEPVDLLVLAGDAVHDARGLDAERTVRLVGLGAHGPEPAVVIGDEDRLRQVVANLVANAVRHTPAGTPIEVAVGRDGNRCVLEVRDHGQGLPPEQAARVFERFYRVDSSRRRDTGGGSGLGLSIVAAVVAAHGGEVSVLPTPGGGATFQLRLPGRPEDTVSTAGPASPARGKARTPARGQPVARVHPVAPSPGPPPNGAPTGHPGPATAHVPGPARSDSRIETNGPSSER